MWREQIDDAAFSTPDGASEDAEKAVEDAEKEDAQAAAGEQADGQPGQ